MSFAIQNTSENIKEQHNSNSNYELVQKIPNSPFELCETEGGYFVRWGNAMLTDVMPTVEDIKKHMKTWKFKIVVNCTCAEIVNNIMKQNEQRENSDTGEEKTKMANHNTENLESH